VGPGTEIPPRSLARGVPARVARTLTDAELEHLVYSAKHYVELKNKYLPDFPPIDQ
jgi:carbonic anhydrase/acetyltransferase-like protein (isoleucine patch superfamily)